MRRQVIVLIVQLGLLMSNPLSASAQASISAADWQAYKEHFVESSGRVIDDANGNISHSEGQGYGLLLSYLAGQKSDFDLIWSFTRTELLLRDDGLAVWKWDPAADPHVSDVNNATDGDLLIAYALALAGASWSRTDFTEAAGTIARAIGTEAVFETQNRMLIRPAVKGFDKDERADAPVVNISYWVFEAFPALSSIVPDVNWQRVSDDGIALISESRLGPKELPPDWISVATRPKPAAGFPDQFGYNALRIPLYLMRNGNRDPELLRPFLKGMSGADGSVQLIDIESGNVHANLADPGYRIILALMSCVLDGVKLPQDVRTFTPTLYYPSTLHLLGLSFANSEHPECLQ